MSRILALLQTSTTSFPSDLVDAIASAGGDTVQIWSGDSAYFGLVAEGDAGVLDAVKSHAAVAFASDSAADWPQSLDIDPGATELCGAWNTYLSSDYQSAASAFYEQPIDITRMFPPGGCFQGADDGDGGGGPAVASNVPSDSPGGAAGLGSWSPAMATLTAGVVYKERRALAGTVGVAVAYVAGPAGSTAEFTASDYTNLALTMLHAFNVYYDLAPKAAKLVFEVNIRRAALTLDPTTVPAPANASSPTGAEFDAAETPWRDAALTVLGQASGWAAINSLISSATFTDTPDYAFAALFSKYPTAWMAYNSAQRKIVFQLAAVTSSWTLAATHFVLAHETGHTSGAPDEYAASQCKITDKAGFSNAPNTNCENGGTAVVDCLMRNNTQKLCPQTPGHFGWGDANGDGVLDPFDTAFSPN